MIVLTVDAGNTRVKWGLHDGGRWLRQSSCASAAAADLRSELAALPPPQAVVVANVAGEAVRQQLLAALPATPPPRWIRSETVQCGVRNGYDDPAQLGCDRWAALIAAYRLHGGPAVVVNVGTALTADALTAAGVFIGGIIAPGPELMRRALANNTAALALRPGSFRNFPTSTGDAIMSGAINALCGAIERVAQFLRQAGEPEPRCVLSGGGAAVVAPHLNLEARVVDNLVLEGLLLIAREG